MTDLLWVVIRLNRVKHSDNLIVELRPLRKIIDRALLYGNDLDAIALD